MSYLTEVYEQLRSARAENPVDALRELERRIMDERSPAVAAVAAGSGRQVLHDVLLGLAAAARDFGVSAAQLDQVAELIARYVGDVFPGGAPVSEAVLAQDGTPAKDSASVPHPAHTQVPLPAGKSAGAAAGQALDHSHTRAWASTIASTVPERASARTTGVCVVADGTQIEVTSGRDPESERAELTLLNSPHFPRPPNSDGGLAVAAHVETKIAQRMREQGTPHAAVVLNNRVCDGRWGCEFAVPAILPLGYTLLVWQPGAGEPLILRGKARP